MYRNRIRVVIYVRVSSKEQVDGYSIGEQIERLEKYAEAMDWEIVKVFVDPGFSGGNMDRPGLKELIKEVETSDIDKVVVYKLDRLSRNQRDTLYLIEDVFLKNNTEFVSMTENFDTSSPFGRAMIGILAVFSQLEREQIKERTMVGKEARAKEGKWHGSNQAPVGYEYVPATDMLVVKEYDALQVREAFDLFLKGTPLRTIATILSDQGYTHSYGKWDAKRVRHVLQNRVYIGYIQYHNEYFKGNHEPIISEEVFNQAQELMAIRAEQYKQFSRKPGAQTTYLGGILYCKRCGGKYAKTTGGSIKYGRLFYYTCYSRSKKVKAMVKDPSCTNKNWRMDELDKLVLDEIKKLAIDSEYMEKLRSEHNDSSDSESKASIIRKEIESINGQISRFMDLYGLGQFTIDQVSQKVNPLNEKRSALEKELAKLNAESGAVTEDQAIELIKSFEDILARGNFNEIRLVIEALIHYIELDGDNVYIHWKFL